MSIWNICLQKNAFWFMQCTCNILTMYKGVENVVADHISRLAITHNSHGLPINDDFSEESLMLLEDASWYAHIANYLVTGEIPSEWKHKIGSTSLQKFMPTIRKNIFFSSIVQIK
ncbi:hypothetical protein AAG906_005880 [Vitis piasezkii]